MKLSYLPSRHANVGSAASFRFACRFIPRTEPGTLKASLRSVLQERKFMGSPHLVDAEQLVKEFAVSDPRLPLVVFSLLGLYFRQGPFAFDAAALVDALETGQIKARLNAQELASLQPELERFFDPRPEGWRPRVGVLEWRDGAHELHGS